MQQTLTVRDIMRRVPVIPVLTIEREADAVPLAKALCTGGLTVLEVTLRTPVALAAIAAMRKAVPEAIVGAGTLTRPADFDRVLAAGGQFAVTPGLTATLAAAARRVGLPLLPGVATASELIAARDEGFDALKFFPAEPAGGAAMLAALAPVFPDIVFCPTGGISRASAPTYLKLANVLCVGGSWVTPSAALESGDWTRIAELAREACTLLQA